MQFRLGPWLVRPDMNSIVRDTRACHVSPKAMEVLLCLARRHGQVVGKDEIFKEVWKETFVSDDSLTRCIGELRRALQEEGGQAAIIQTIPKRGYLLLPPVTWDEGGKGVPSNQPSETVSLAETVLSSSAAAPAATRATYTSGQFPIWKHRWLSIAAALALLGILLLLQGRHSSAGAPHTIRSLAVLPLANLSGDPEQEYFADGMTEELITELAQLKACDVISRTSVMRYKGSKKALREIARDLSVDGVVEGTALRSGTKVRITAQLIDAMTDKHIWSGSFEQELSDALTLQDTIARAIAAQLNLALSSQVQDRSRLSPKVVPEAYEAYLRGWYLMDRGQYPKAASYFEQATQSDPNFALGYALLFEADAMTSFIQDLPISDRALKAMERARQLDDNLAEEHDAEGDVLMAVNLDWEGAQAEYRRAIELDPGSVDAALHYSGCLHELTRWQEAEEQIRRALRFDPVSPNVNMAMLRLLVDTHRYDLAQEQFQKLVELDPNNGSAYDEMVTVYLALGREQDATAALLKAETLWGTSSDQVNALTVAAQHAGFRGCVRKRIEQLQQQSQSGRVLPFNFARLYVRLGDNERAFKFLEDSYRQHSGRMIWIKARAIWDPLRPNPRYQSLLRRMRFPE